MPRVFFIWFLLVTPLARSAAADGSSPSATRRFIAVGDTGRGNDEEDQVAAAMAKKCAADGCDFVLLLGDNIYPTGVTSVDDPQWREKFERPFAALALPFFAALGNHDYGGFGKGNEPDKAAHQVLYTGVSERWRMPAPYYRVSDGVTELIALDTNTIIDGVDTGQRATVEQWLAPPVAGAATPWRIAFGHHPLWSNGPHGDAGSYDKRPASNPRSGIALQHFLEEVVCGKVDIYLSGHEHNIQALRDHCGGRTALLISGGGSGINPIGGGHAMDAQAAALGFMYFVATEKRLSYQVITVDEGIILTRELVR